MTAQTTPFGSGNPYIPSYNLQKSAPQKDKQNFNMKGTKKLQPGKAYRIGKATDTSKGSGSAYQKMRSMAA
jgi:hypothetical protein